jgi:hypothetical protein
MLWQITAFIRATIYTVEDKSQKGSQDWERVGINVNIFLLFPYFNQQSVQIKT